MNDSQLTEKVARTLCLNACLQNIYAADRPVSNTEFRMMVESKWPLFINDAFQAIRIVRKHDALPMPEVGQHGEGLGSGENV